MDCLLIYNIGLLQTPVGSFPHSGAAQGENLKLHDAAVIIRDGVIDGIASDGAMPEGAGAANERIDAQGRLVTPGLIDSHTHLVFGGWRQNEIPMKLSGVGYMDILRAGGGILSTVAATRAMEERALYERSYAFLDEMLGMGVTSAEVKSGYGLDLETELKQLRVIRWLNETHMMDVVPTFLGAHAVPAEYSRTPDRYVDYLVDTVLPEVARQRLSRYCDVFCEDGAFNLEQSRRVLGAAKKLGMGLKIHADEIKEIGGVSAAGELGAVSADHLISTGEEGMRALADGGVTANLLPQTSFYLGKPYAPARRMIELGIPVAISSDFNPGSCPSLNLQLAINLGYLRYRMFPEEVLTAVTVNGACAAGLECRVGTIEDGKQADLVIWDAADFDTVCYRFGSNLAAVVIKAGKVV